MVPAEIFVIDVMPLTPSGKTDVAALPAHTAGFAKPAYIAPRNELEEQLAEIWVQALGVEQVGIHDNFFALRGHSLLATQVIARVAGELQLEIPLQSLFESPTVAGLARNVEALRWTVQQADEPPGEAGDREVVRL
jgi:acyl carrier protein